MVDLLQIKQNDQIPVTYEVTEEGLDLKNIKSNTIIRIPVMTTDMWNEDEPEEDEEEEEPVAPIG